MPNYKYDDTPQYEENHQEFDLSSLPEQKHEWRQEGNQPLLRCALHNHTAILPPNVHAAPDEKGEFTLIKSEG